MRGESGRVAARVRSLLGEHGGPAVGAESTGAVGAVDERAVSWWQRLVARVPVRIDPGRRAALAVAGAVALAAVLTGAWLVAERPRALAVPSSPTPIAGASSPAGTRSPARAGPAGAGAHGSASGPATPAASPGPSAEVVVDVAGKVRHPGVYRLPAGSRVENALTAAGGPLAGVNLDSLNLAAKVVDGQQIAVGVPPALGGGGAAAGAGSAGGNGGSDGGGAPVDLNTATLEQLETLPGVGPVLGQHILDWRSAHGRFATVDQLNDVPGIGDVKFAALRGRVSV